MHYRAKKVNVVSMKCKKTYYNFKDDFCKMFVDKKNFD